MDFAAKASSRVALNTRLLAIAIAIFFLIITFKAELLYQKIVVLQLVLAIPLLLTSALSYSKVGYRKYVEKWDTFGWITFTIGYAFILDTVGILIGNVISFWVSVVFFLASWILMMVYSFVDVNESRLLFRKRFIKSLLFIVIQIVLGLFVVIGLINF